MAKILACSVAITSGCASHRPTAPPTPSAVAEYRIPWENAFPSDIAIDTAGRVWFTDRVASVIGRFDPASGEFGRFETPRPKAAPYGIVAAEDGGLWYAGSRAGSLGRLDPATGEVVEHRIPGADGGPHLLAIADGRIWFSLREGRAWGRYDPRTGESRIHEAPDRLRPYSVVVTPDGTIWMSAYEQYHLLSIDPRTDSVTVIDLAAAPSDSATAEPAPIGGSGRVRRMRDEGQTRRIAADVAGNLWIADFRRGRATRYDPARHRREHFPTLMPLARPYGIAVDTHGRVWYAERGEATVVVLDPATGERVRLPVREGATIRQIALDERRARVWLPLSDAGIIGRIDLLEPARD